MNLTLAYTSPHHWSARVNVDIALDKDYLLTGINRNAVFIGSPRNVRLSARYMF